MDALIRYGFSVEEIRNIMNTNEDINNITDKDINEVIKILEKYNCKINHIKNIIITNPFILTRDLDEIEKTIKVLIEFSKRIEVLLDTNPFVLNISDRDIISIVNDLSNKGYNKNDLCDYFYFNI